jgi:hypothetical protein
MTLRLRRGTNAQRLTITPAEGEAIYTTDTKNVYIGDGTTVGGILVSGGGIIDGTLVGDVKGSVFADDSTIMVDAITGNIYAIDLNATTVNATTVDATTVNATTVDATTVDAITVNASSIIGSVIGDIRGSVFGDDSTLIIDALNSSIQIENVFGKDNKVIVRPSTDSQTNSLVIIGTEATSEIILQYDSSLDKSGDGDSIYGAIYFGRNDAVTNITTSGIFGNRDGLFLGSDSTGNLLNEASYLTISEDKVGMGTFFPEYTLDIIGDGRIANFTFTTNVLDTDDSSGITITPAVTMSGDLTVENDLRVNNKITVDTLEYTTLVTSPSEGTPALISDGTILLTAATRVEISSSPLKMASFTTSERDLLSAENGDAIYNTTDHKFQGYANGVWVDLN